MTVNTDSVAARTAARMPDATGPVPFEPGSLLWEWAGLQTFVLGANSAFLLQAMHPAIGAVVDRWSTYRTDPWGERPAASPAHRRPAPATPFRHGLLTHRV